MSMLVKAVWRMRKRPAPYWTEYPLGLLVWKRVRKLLNVVVIPNVPIPKLRIQLYRLVGFRIGKNVFIGMKCYLDDMDPSKTVIEDDAVISYGCYFAIHGVGQEHSEILIKKGAYVGMRSNLIGGKSGIVLGEKAVVGAASVVTRSVPDFATAVGNPARVIKVGGRKKRPASQPFKLEAAKRSDTARPSVSDRPHKKAA